MPTKKHKPDLSTTTGTTTSLVGGSDTSKLHAVLRDYRAASAAMNHWDSQYKENPTDDNAVQLQLAWKALRKSVDEIVAMATPMVGASLSTWDWIRPTQR